MAIDFSSMGGLVKQAKEMQDKISAVQSEMAGRTVVSTSGGGMVTATANGAGEIVSIKLEKEIINPSDQEMLSDLIVAAVNDALRKSQRMVSDEMSKLTGGFNIPGLFK
ncbi:MAG: YbaB/EbfC family nucleoid-associated protein [Candidatus Adiutrix sp.]